MGAYEENEALNAEHDAARREREHSVPDRIGRSERLPYFPPDGQRVVRVDEIEGRPGWVRVVLEVDKCA